MESKRRFGFFRTLYFSFYSKALYQDVAKRWQGTAAFYLLLLVVLHGLVCAVFFSPAGFAKAHAAIHGGQVSTVTQSSVTTINSGVDEEQNQIMQISSEGTVERESLDTSAADRDDRVSHVNPFSIMMKFFQVALSVVGYFVILIIGLIAALIGRLFASHLSYKSVYRLALVSTTPAAILSMIFFVLPDNIMANIMSVSPLSTLILPLVTLGYFIYAIRSNRKTDLL